MFGLKLHRSVWRPGSARTDLQWELTAPHRRPRCCSYPHNPYEDCYHFRCLVNRGTMGVNSLPKTVNRQRCGCDLNPGPIYSVAYLGGGHWAIPPPFGLNTKIVWTHWTPKKISGEGAQPPPQTRSSVGRGHPLPTLYPIGASNLASLALPPLHKILNTPLYILRLSPAPCAGASTPYKRWSKCTMKKIGGRFLQELRGEVRKLFVHFPPLSFCSKFSLQN